jgi:uncharacterized protein YbbC (DUF1343 family)
MRTIGLETFLPCTSFLRTLRAMKYSKGTGISIELLKYAKLWYLSSILVFLLGSCSIPFARPENKIEETIVIEDEPIAGEEEIREMQNAYHGMRPPMLGVERLHLFTDSLINKRIAVVGNQTSVVGNVHLVDSLLGMGLNVVKVFAPEHGFRGQADAGEKVHSTIDEKTGIPLISLYGNHKKPTAEQLSDVDIVIYDIQDVGVRFYTYISTLHYVMESCAENKKQLIVLDRPNPNGHYIDGPIREPQHRSFVGMHPVPIVYGMTIGEYAMMINGEHWLADSLVCNLWVIPCKNYTHKTKYILPVPPSPNLKSELAITFYPSLCMFEATTVSVGRGTEWPFEVYGHPRFPELDFCFTPIPMPGAKSPLHENKLCYGFDLANGHQRRKYEINLNYLIKAKELLGDSLAFITQTGFFDRLAGTSQLREQIMNGWSAKEIKETWKPGLEQFKAIRKKYLLYP